MAAAPTHPRRAPEAASDEGAAARLALAGVFLFSGDAAECAQATVDWLGDHAGARRAICALIDVETGRIENVAARGVPASQLDSLSIALDQPDDPMMFALAGRDAVTVPRNG